MGFDEARKGRGLYTAEVVRAGRITPNMVRVTVGGPDMGRLPRQGFDHWFRLFLPRLDGPTDFSHIPDHFGAGSYMKYMAQTKSETRPVLRNYTVRNHRPEAGELDIDFVAHGDIGEAGPWAQQAQPGEKIVILDQGCGFDLAGDGDFYLLVGDESALPAILGILRDMPRNAEGLAIIEVPESADVQDAEGPKGVEVRWIARNDHATAAGALALKELSGFTPPDPEILTAYIAGERTLATEGRRHLVREGVGKHRITFSGYWRAD
ncbi:MAG: siderophore-interacting protein [Ancrocorticia sp.]|uniref:siderophore-interacting protein n=1 Tax=Ancrocorticia sp. TaxID=2593684 RepID=UPI003F905B6A